MNGRYPPFFTNKENNKILLTKDPGAWASLVYETLKKSIVTLMSRDEEPPCRLDFKKLCWPEDDKIWGVYGCVVWSEADPSTKEGVRLYVGSGTSVREGVGRRRRERERDKNHEYVTNPSLWYCETNTLQ